MDPRLLVVQVAALGHDFLTGHGVTDLCGLTLHSAQSVFPALTCPVQASLRTGCSVQEHGMVANGLFHRTLRRPLFWEQSAAQVSGSRVWDAWRARGQRVAMLFWQQSLGESVDLVLSPAPIHKHHGGMIQDCYSRPDDLYQRCRSALRRPFSLMHYWGPMASFKSSAWIAEATRWVLSDPETAPDLCFTYLPVLDYDLQRYGTRHDHSRRALDHALSQLAGLKTEADARGYDMLIVGDYAIADCAQGPTFPNRALHAEGLMRVRAVRGMAYPDLFTSRAFAVADHEVAHVYVRHPSGVAPTRAVLESLPGIGEVLDRDAQAVRGAAHPAAGELMLLAEPGRWIAYPWWETPSEEPDYARHVDIHNKPGYDPCELFWGWPPGSVSRNVSRVMGSHGRTDSGRKVAWACTRSDVQAESLLDLAAAIRNWKGKGNG